MFSRTTGLKASVWFCCSFFFLHVHVKMIILGSRCLTGCKPVCCYSAVGGCVMLLTGCLDGRLAGLQCVSGVVILVLICVGQGLVWGCRCITDIALHSTVAPWPSAPLMLLPSVIQFQMCTAQCMITLSNNALPADTELTLMVTACDVIQHISKCIKCSSLSQQLFREVRIMKLLNHPNIGRFREQRAVAVVIFPFVLSKKINIFRFILFLNISSVSALFFCCINTPVPAVLSCTAGWHTNIIFKGSIQKTEKKSNV